MRVREARTAGVSALTVACLMMSGCMARGVQKEELATEVTDFDALYGKNCAGCHGAQGKNGAAQALNDSLYLKLIPKEELRRLTELGRAGMPAFATSEGGALLPKQVDALVNGLEQHWARPVDLGSTTLPPYSVEGQSGNAERGHQVYDTACASCHGKNARAGSITDVAYLQLVSNQSLRTSTIVGRPHQGMPDWRTVASGHALSDQDIADVVEYLASFRPATEDSDAPKVSRNEAPASSNRRNEPASAASSNNDAHKTEQGEK